MHLLYLNLFNIEPTDLISHKRFLSFLEGGILPIISLSFLHMLVVYTEDLKNIIIPKSKDLEILDFDNEVLNDKTEISPPKIILNDEVNIEPILEQEKEIVEQYSPQRIKLAIKPPETPSDELLINNDTNVSERENDAIKASLARKMLARNRR